ncbi:flagellar biosynthesis protein FliQ [bacterium]|nr:flagellar biosynthesis protein FliQ [bacterium]
MDNTIILSITQTVLVLILQMMAPVLVIATVVGLVISVFQTVTQIQESTLTFVPKIIVCVLTLIILLPWMVNIFIERTNELFAQIPALIH